VWFWDGVSFVLGPDPLRVLGILGAAALAVKRNVRAALLLLTCLPLSGFVTAAAKGMAGRPRPATALIVVPETSFPSGHALEGMAAALALLTVTLPLLGAPARRIAVGAAALCVLAGWALGYLYFLLCLLVIRPTVWSRRGDPTGAEPLLDPAL
jgi:membrane-associated phospholipid phosphatase